jgi:hypothetical protein
MELIYILVFVFAIIILWQIFLGDNKIVEGLDFIKPPDFPKTNLPTTNPPNTSNSMTYQPYNLNDPNNALILSQQNAGNINFLKTRIDNLDNIKNSVEDLKLNVRSLQTQVNGLVQQQADFGQQIAGSTPATITGTGATTTKSVEESINEAED